MCGDRAEPDRSHRDDEGISGYGAVERYKPYLKPFILQLREALIGEDPTLVERVMLGIRLVARSSPGAARKRHRDGALGRGRKAAGLPFTSCSAARCATACASTTAPPSAR
jgi:hypothetical protein